MIEHEDETNNAGQDWAQRRCNKVERNARSSSPWFV